MKQTKRWAVLLLALLMTLSMIGLPVMAQEQTEDKPAQEAASDLAQLAMSYSGATSMQYALVVDGEVTVSGSAGVYSRSENRLLTSDILYGVGSVSKIYTTAAVMKLVDMGKVNLDAPITSYIPDFKMADERYQKITVRMLLNHSSGLLGSTMGSAFLFHDNDTIAKDNLLNNLSTQRLKADPGAYSVYCNDGFTLAEILVERVSGISFTDFIHQYITNPLGLKNTYTPVDSFDRSKLAKLYQGDSVQALPDEAVGIIGTGGVYASAQDLARFGAGLCIGQNKVLSDASLKAMANEEYKRGIWPKDGDNSLAYGLGWDSVEFWPFEQNEIQALVKGGDTLFYHAGLVVLPEYHMAAAVVSSGGSSPINEMFAAKLLAQALKDKGIELDETGAQLLASEPATMPTSLLDYAGLYGTSTMAVLVDINEDGSMTIRMPAMPTMPAQTYQYYADGTFRDENGVIMFQFIEEKNGLTYLWQKAYSTLEGLGQSPISIYAYQKLPNNTLSVEVLSAWQARSQKIYLLLNEKYSSQIYTAQIPATSIPLLDATPGYILSMPITDENTAKSIVQIPGTSGRDCQDFKFYQENGTEYLTALGMLFMDSSATKGIFSGSSSVCTILQDGYARWYQVGEAGGKTMQVNLPQKGAFYVYDDNMSLLYDSWVHKDTSITLPQSGWIVFAGDANEKFEITMS